MWSKDIANEVAKALLEMPDRIAERMAEAISRIFEAHGTQAGGSPFSGVADAAKEAQSFRTNLGQTSTILRDAADSMRTAAKSMKDMASESFASVSSAWNRMEQDASSSLPSEEKGGSWRTLLEAGRAATRARWQKATEAPGQSPGLFAGMTPAFLARYEKFGSLGPGDTLGSFLDQNPGFKDIFAMGAVAAGPRLLSRMPGLPAMARQMGVAAASVRVLSVTTGSTGLPALLAGGGAGGMGGGGGSGLAAAGGAFGGQGGGFGIARAGQSLPQQIGQQVVAAMTSSRFRVLGVTTNYPSALPASPPSGPGFFSRIGSFLGSLGWREIMGPLGIAYTAAAVTRRAVHAVEQIEQFPREQLESNRYLSRFSPSIAGSFQKYDIAGAMRNVRIARQMELNVDTLAQSFSRAQDDAEPLTVARKKFLNYTATGVSETYASLARFLRPAAEAVSKDIDKAQQKDDFWAKLRLTSITSGLGGTAFGLTGLALGALFGWKAGNAEPGAPQSGPWEKFIQDTAKRGMLRPPRPIPDDV